MPDPAAPAEGEYAEYTEEQQYAVGRTLKQLNFKLQSTMRSVELFIWDIYSQVILWIVKLITEYTDWTFENMHHF